MANDKVNATGPWPDLDAASQSGNPPMVRIDSQASEKMGNILTGNETGNSCVLRSDETRRGCQR